MQSLKLLDFGKFNSCPWMTIFKNDVIFHCYIKCCREAKLLNWILNCTSKLQQITHSSFEILNYIKCLPLSKASYIHFIQYIFLLRGEKRWKGWTLGNKQEEWRFYFLCSHAGPVSFWNTLTKIIKVKHFCLISDWFYDIK